MADTLTVKDNRTGKEYEIEISDGTVRAADFRGIKVDDDDFGLMLYDPAFKNTASCRSAITLIDGDKGILRYRGYPIEQLAEQSTFLEVAYLLLWGELPNESELAEWSDQITNHTYVHQYLIRGMEGFKWDAHAMGKMVSLLGTLSTFYEDSKQVRDASVRREHIIKIIAKMPTIAAWCFRHMQGRPYIYPDNELGYVGNFMNMLFRMAEPSYKPNPVIARALDVLFILHADHEQNCSASAARAVGSAETDPYCSLAAASAALYGPLHGGANEAVLRMLREIGNVGNIPGFIEGVKNRERRLMGFGHRVYKNYDPRARIIKGLAHEVFAVTGKNPLLDIALELEKIALDDDFFVSRKLYPNVDFYSGLIYQSIGFPVEFFPVLFAIPRAVGWLAQWQEMLSDAEQKIARPRQIYVGADKRDYVPMSERG
ncbi:citrate synthase [Plesiocystis pacifica SIR-1]|uniref:Citrate synthase n=1 Tax=Plesiocystis pacifica SIR-1 TaxID=391625 RepID=A6GF09_9BACT|nr:citrate synthase [Plesiocystis pacifica]EDM75536.1 citrate synthase [Plesiocystis pacifica SIR-1]